MNNEIIVKQRKKLNIFQKARLKFQENRKQISFEEYTKLPEYIKEDAIIIRTLFRTNDLTEDQIIQIPKYQLETAIGIRNLAHKFSVPKKAEFIEKGYLNIKNSSEEEKNSLLDFMVIQNKQYAFVRYISGDRTDEINCLRLFKEKGQLEEVLPNVIDYFSETVKDIIEKRPNLLGNLSQEKQENCIQKEPNLLAYAKPEIQLQYIEKDIRCLKNASNDVKKMLIERNPDMIINLDFELQLEMVSAKPSLMKKLPFETQKNIYKLFGKSSQDTERDSNIIINLLKDDMNNTKYLDFIENHYVDDINLCYYKLFDGIEEWNNDKLINTILHSKMMSAIGCIDEMASLRTGRLQITDGKVRYNKEQIRIIQKLSQEQISELINIDSNYSLAFFLDKENGREECKQLFSYMYGEDKLQEYEKSIDIIFDKEIEEKKKNVSRNNGVEPIEERKLPLEELKVIFNKTIIEKNSALSIEEYLQNGNADKELFRKIIQKAYGEKAYEILKSRPELDAHNINSLEIFSDNILGEYGEAFVHDCISYNLVDFSEFLDVTKNPQKQELFNTYYAVLTKVYGENVETMQKAISEYSYIEELLENARNVELTDKQYTNLISVMCSNRNPYDIKTLVELQNYHEIANQELEQQMRGCQDIEDLKELISTSFLGMHYGYETEYGDSVEYLNLIYDLQKESKTVYTNDEKKMLEVLSFLHNEENTFKVQEFAYFLMQQEGIRNPIALQTAINKTKEEQTNILNQSLLGIDRLEDIIEKEKDKEDPLAYKEEIDGVEVYHLNGIDYTVLQHDPFMGIKESEKASARNRWIDYEGQQGTTNICCAVENSKFESRNINGFLFTKMDNNMIVGIGKKDMQTSHQPKLVRNSSLVSHCNVEDISKMVEQNNVYYETSFNRRYKDHRKVNNQNRGGRLLPDAYGIDNISLLTDDIKEFCRKYKIPVYCLHDEKYIEKEQQNQKEEGR